MSDVYDVIIVGAGLSGLSSAYHLRNKCGKDLRVLIIEGKDRVGGRTQTVELNCSKEGKKVKLDAGGQWVTDTQKHVTKLINEFNIETYTQFDAGKKILECDGKIVTYSSSIPNISVFSLLGLMYNLNKINKMAKKVNTLQPFETLELADSLDKKSLETFVGATAFTRASKAIVESAVRVIYGLELSQINSLFGLFYVSSGGSFESLALAEKGCAQEKRVKGGTQQISQKLLEHFLAKSSNNSGEIKLNTALVKVIQTEADLVTLITEDTNTGARTTYQAKKVISSIPINQYVNIKFEPELPYFKRNVFKFMQMGNYIKFIATFKRAFWREKGFSGEVVSDGSVVDLNGGENVPTIGPIACLFDATTNDDEPALVGFVAAKAAVQWLDRSQDERRDEIIKCLVRYFGDEANEYVEFFEKAWSNEKFTGGCPTVNVSAGGVMKDYVRATREPFLNLHFCGTESATRWQGYMDGAIESGERVANEVLYQMFKDDKSVEYEYDKTYYYQREEAKKLKVKSGQCQITCWFKLFAPLFLIAAVFYVIFMRCECIGKFIYGN